MIFSSLTFLCLFLPVTVGLYYLLPEKLKNGFLFAASLVFYAWGEPKYILLMLFSAAFDYMNGLLLDRARQKGKRAAMKAVLALSVAVNLGLLAFFKYAGFFVDNLNALGWFYLPFSAPPLPISWASASHLSILKEGSHEARASMSSSSERMSSAMRSAAAASPSSKAFANLSLRSAKWLPSTWQPIATASKRQAGDSCGFSSSRVQVRSSVEWA